MNNRKFRLLPIILLILTVSCFLAFTSCGGSKDIEVAMSASNQPKVTYVLGQELDLSKGAITVLTDGRESQVPLSDPGVTVSGYNKDQLGNQTLTVTYNEKSITYDITVVERVTAEGYEKNYFIGDSFNNSKGKLKITNDDATVTSINLNNPNVTVKDFDSASDGEKTVTLSYSDDKGASYEVTVKVNVYKVGEITLVKPNKTSYSSHETSISVEGGYLNVKADGLDSLTKLVNITPDMISGFDPSVVTEEYRETPMEQTITVTYAGKSLEFKISIIYSPISVILNAIETVKDIDPSAESIEFTPEQGDAIMEAITEYFKLTEAKKQLVQKESADLAKISTRYLMQLFANEVIANSDVFIINNDGDFVLNKATQERTLEIAKKLDDANDNFNVLSSLLRKVKEEFAWMPLMGTTSIGKFIVVPTAENVQLYSELFNLLSKLHASLEDVPEDWKVEDLEKYSQNITTAVHLIASSGCFGPKFNQVYLLLQSWRPKNDFFDIIYSYYYYVAEDGHDFILTNLWMKVPLPGSLQDWYTAFYNAMYQAQYMATENAFFHDTTMFMHYYFESYRLADKVKNGDNEFYKELYNVIDGDLYMDNNIKRPMAGYLSLSGIFVTSDTINELWEKYLNIYSLELKGELNVGVHEKEFRDFFDTFCKLSPTEMIGFLSSLHYMYIQSGGTQYALDFSQKANSQFIYYLANYLIVYLPENARPAINLMFTAIESFAIHYVFPDETNALETFKNAIAMTTSVYNGLSAEDKAVFDNYLGNCYSKYLTYYNSLDDSYEYELGEWEAKLDELQSVIKSAEKVNAYISDQDTPEAQKKQALVLLFSLYERAESLYNEIINSGNNDAIAALYTKKTLSGDIETNTEMLFFSFRGVVMNYMLSINFTGTTPNGSEVNILFWDLYSNSELDIFFKEMSYVLLARFENASLETSRVSAAMNAYLALSASDKNLFTLIGSSYYYDTLNIFFSSLIDSSYNNKYGENKNVEDVNNVKKLAAAILETEMNCTGYLLDPTNAEAVNNFKTHMETAIELYNKILDTEIRDNLLGGIYNYYMEIYNSIEEA